MISGDCISLFMMQRVEKLQRKSKCSLSQASTYSHALESTTAASEAGDKSTKTTNTDGSSSGDDLVTKSSSWKSNSRPANKRGPKRRERNLQRLIAHESMKNPNFVWEYQEREEKTIATAEAAALAAGLSHQGREAVESHKKCIQNIKKATKDEKIELWTHYELPESQESILEIRNGDIYCRVCHKFGWAHCHSGPHLVKIEEHALGTLLAGPTSTARRYEKDTTGMPGKLTKRACLSYWGEALDNLPNAAHKIVHRKGAIFINGTAKGQRISPEMIDSLTLGVVSYKGDGKYDHSTYWHWHLIPDSEDHIHDESYGLKEYLQPPPGQGWWPVIAIWPKKDVYVKKGGKVLAICFYQLMAEPLIAWWIGHAY